MHSGLIIKARKLRKNRTKAEQLLEPYLRDRRMLGWKFRRQHPVKPYILDFACKKLKLAFELDGAHHPFQSEYDAARDAYLRRAKWKVLRIGNDDVEFRLHAVLEMICFEIEMRRRELGLSNPHPDPLPKGEGETWSDDWSSTQIAEAHQRALQRADTTTLT
jgi:very-short-patch-repair endonuclease